MNFYAGEKPFKCDLCDYATTRRGNLRTHQRIHTGEKPYQCEQCDKAFATKHKLTQHILVHTGEKPYKCDTCDYACNQQGNLKIHKKTCKHTVRKTPFVQSESSSSNELEK